MNIQINITRLRIPTGGRQTSWLFTSVAEKLNSGFGEQHQLAVRTGFEPATYRFQIFQIRRSNRSATLPSEGYQKQLMSSYILCKISTSF